MSEQALFDLAIVGYGPTGQTLALLMARKGYRVAVVDRWPNLYPLPRAVHFDHEIGRILQAAGVVDDVNAIAETIDTYQWRNAKRELLLELDWRGMGPSGWPISNMFAQPDLERVLDTHAKRLPNVTFFQGWSATALTQHAASAELAIERGEVREGHWQATGERRTLAARWVVGADGANSFVRRSLGIEMQDLGFEFDWLVVDIKPTVAREWTPKTWQLCDPARPTTLVPGGPGRRRWEFMLLPGETREQMNQAKTAWDLLATWDVTPANAEMERHAVYTFRGQWAHSWKQGRVLLAGDAAHLMPPFAGQGMCSGMRDSMALAWRLDAVLSGRLDAQVLESYGPERSAHVQQMIGFSIELGKVICITDPEIAAHRDRDMLAAQQQPDYAPPPPPQPRLGAGLYQDDAPGSGLLGLQARVRANGREGLFDDLFGQQFVLLAQDAQTLAAISPANRAALQAQGAVLVHLGEGGLGDVQGAYTQWLAQLSCQAVLMRPDFYVYGGASDAQALNALLDGWRQALRLDGAAPARARRLDRLGVHSIGEFHMTVPSLDDAQRFYEAFGLRVSREGDGLILRAHGDDHVWGRLSQGPKKRFDRLTFHCFADDLDRLAAHFKAEGVALVPAPAGADPSGLWMRDPDGVHVQVRPGPKTTIDAAAHRQAPLPVDGVRCAPYRSKANPVLPQRLSHMARMTPSVPRQLDFYTRVLGLRLSDRSGDGVAFLHGPHGSDHHLVAFAMGEGVALHHLSWDVPTIEDVGNGMSRMQAAGYTTGWGVGRHVLGSNYFYYAQDPWGSWCEFSATIDYIPAQVDWQGLDHPPEDSFYLWGPPLDPIFFANSEA